MEHRWGNRIAVDVRVRISSAGVVGHGTMRNISVSGAFIETPLPLATLALVRISVPRNSKGARLEGDGRGFVVRADHCGVGVEWCELATLGDLARPVPRQPYADRIAPPQSRAH